MKSRGGAWKDSLPLWRWSSGNKQPRTSSGPSHSVPGLWSTARGKTKQNTRKVRMRQRGGGRTWKTFTWKMNFSGTHSLLPPSEIWSFALHFPGLISATALECSPSFKDLCIVFVLFSHHALVPQAELVMAVGCRGVTKPLSQISGKQTTPSNFCSIRSPIQWPSSLSNQDALVICYVVSLVSSKGLTKFE